MSGISIPFLACYFCTFSLCNKFYFLSLSFSLSLSLSVPLFVDFGSSILKSNSAIHPPTNQTAIFFIIFLCCAVRTTSFQSFTTFCLPACLLACWPTNIPTYHSHEIPSVCMLRSDWFEQDHLHV